MAMVPTLRRSAPCKSAPLSSSWLLAVRSGTSGKVGEGRIGPPPCRSSHLPCSFLTQCLKPGPCQWVLLSSLPLLLCFSLFWVYCQEAGAVGSQCLCWRDNRVLRLPCWGAGQPLGAAPLPPAQDGLCWPEAVPLGNPGFCPMAVRHPGLVSARAQHTPVSLPECRDTFWVTSWTLFPDLATESFLSAVMVFVSKNPFGSFIKSCCYFIDTKSSLYEDFFF